MWTHQRAESRKNSHSPLPVMHFKTPPTRVVSTSKNVRPVLGTFRMEWVLGSWVLTIRANLVYLLGSTFPLDQKMGRRDGVQGKK